MDQDKDEADRLPALHGRALKEWRRKPERAVVGQPGDDLDALAVDCRGEPLDLGPATRADLEDLDAVPEPVDSSAPAVTYLPGAAPIGPSAETRPIRRPR